MLVLDPLPQLNLALSTVVQPYRFIWLSKLVNLHFLSVFCRFMFFVRVLKIPNWVSWFCLGCFRYPSWSFVLLVTARWGCVSRCLRGGAQNFSVVSLIQPCMSSLPPFQACMLVARTSKKFGQKRKPKLWTFIWCFRYSHTSSVVSLNDFWLTVGIYVWIIWSTNSVLLDLIYVPRRNFEM